MQPKGRLRTVVADDEAMARHRLCRLLGQDAEIDIIAECCEGREAVQVLLESKVDLLFLDVQMPEMDGFQVLRALPDGRTPIVVFVTAYDKYAIEAFDASATDYLLKPFHPERFAKAVARAKAQVTATQAGPGGTARAAQLAVRSGRSVILLKQSEIDWIEAANNYVCIHCGAVVHIGRDTLANVEKRLSSAEFVRIHRSVIVNSARVREIQPLASGDGRVLLQDGTLLSLSRTFRVNLEHLWQRSA